MCRLLLAPTLVLKLGLAFGAVPLGRERLGDADTSNVEPFFAVRIVFCVVASDHLAERDALTEAVRRVVLLFTLFTLAHVAVKAAQEPKGSEI